MQILNMILYTAITLGILVFIHELGHFLAAKLTGMRVDRFSIGFPPRAFGKKIGDTDYCVSWLPLGGYVKIAGMVDESFDTEFTQREPQPWEFRARPMWARMLVISAGVIMNVLLAIGIFWYINLSHGRIIQETTRIGYVVAGSAAQQGGLLAGDSVLAVNGRPVTHWDELQSAIYIDNIGSDLTLRVDRGGGQRDLIVPASAFRSDGKQPFGIIEAHTEVMISAVEPGMPAAKLGLQPEDIIVAINGEPIHLDSSVILSVQQHAGKELTVSWKRGGQLMSGVTVPTAGGRIGIRLGNYYTGPKRVVSFGAGEALVVSVGNVYQSTKVFFVSIGQIITGRSSFRENFGGPIAIAQMATQSAETGLTAFLGFMALLSMSLAVINILPFPALDGGHLAMLAFEKVFRREIPYKVKIAIQQAGFIMLLALMAVVIYNDISRF